MINKIFLGALLAPLAVSSASFAAECVQNLEVNKGVIGEIIQCLKTMEQENSTLKKKIQELEGNPTSSIGIGVPSGAVVAFDPDIKKQSACPKGWSHFEPSGGRVIIGAGDHNNKWYSNGTSEPVPLKIYPSYVQDERAEVQETPKARATGGEESVKLKIDQMPSHDHSGTTRVDSGAAYWRDRISNTTLYFNNTTSPGTSFDNTTRHSHEIPSQGGGQAHNNMPPYIALYFCKKD